ncbi:hypothetical protein V0R37_21915, partial [Pollutimonas sp. H1-120]
LHGDQLAVAQHGDALRHFRQFFETVEPIDRYSSDELVTLMVGRDVGDAIDLGERQIGAPLLQISNLCRRGKVDDVSFSVRAGEIYGISGLIG